MLAANLRKELSAGIAAAVQFDYSLKRHTTLGIGGEAAAFVSLATREELSFVLRFCHRESLPLLCLGRGSNVLFAAERFYGVVVRLTGEFTEIAVADRAGGVAVRCGAGATLGQLGKFCLEHGIGGMEFASAIPGTVGGAVLMNAGAWGSDMAEVVHGVELLGTAGSCTAEGAALDFTYRRWPWLCQQKEQMVITAATLHLVRDSSANIGARCRDLAARRKQAQGVTRANAGSFFRNPPGESAGRLIDTCGLKGLRVGDAMVAEEHANFLVNMGAATAADILELMAIVQQKVEEKHGIRLEPEVKIIH